MELTVLSGNNEHIVRIPIGYDDQSDHTFSLVATLSPWTGALPGEFEQTFFIAETAGTEAEIYSYFEPLTVRNFIPNPADRALIRVALLGATEMLIDVAKPSIVTFCTFEPNLPDKALEKFHQIAEIYRKCGYDARKADPYHGRQIWLAELQN